MCCAEFSDGKSMYIMKDTLHQIWQETTESNCNQRFWRPPFYHWTTLLSGGEERIRTSGTGLPYNSLANCHLQPLGHSSIMVGRVRFELTQTEADSFTDCCNSPTLPPSLRYSALYYNSHYTYIITPLQLYGRASAESNCNLRCCRPSPYL